MDQRIVVTGLGCIGSHGTTTHDFKKSLLAGDTGIGPIDAFDTSEYRSRQAVLLQDYDAAAFIDPARLRRVDRIGRLVLSSCRLALDDASLTGVSEARREQVGVALGSYTVGVRSTVEYLDNLISHGPSGASPFLFSSTVGNAAASLCGIEFGLRGPNITLTNKEASSLAAVAAACRLLRHRHAEAVVCGGADEVEPVFYSVLDRFGVLSPVDHGEEHSRPFDRRRNGFVLGEGSFLLVVESLTAVTSRDADWYGEILGIGATASIGALNQWPMTAEPLTRCMQSALDNSGVSEAEVDVVFASANSTTQLDQVESEALTDVFGPHGAPVVSLKGAIGEFGGTGAAAIAAALLCLQDDVVPPTVGCDEPDPSLNVDVSSRRRTIRPGPRGPVALVNSFASGGTNYSVVVRGNPT